MKPVWGPILASAGIAFAAFAVSGVGATSRATITATPGETPTELCPYQTAEEWQRFLQNYADDERWVETCEDNACDEKYVAYVRDNIEHTLDRCAAFILRHDSIERCTMNLRRFTPVWLRQHDSVSYGFAVGNHEYLAAQEGPGQPDGMMKIPDPIVAALPDRARVEAAARKNGFKYLTHDSGLGGTRTFIYIPDPDGRYDRWMLLNLADSDAGVKQNTPLSILAVQKKDGSGRPLEKVKLHFRDYTIEQVPHRPGSYKLSLFEENNGKCFSCHANGVRQLIARRTPVLEAMPVEGEAVSDTSDFAFNRLNEFNRRLRSYGSPDWDGMIDPRANGPALGKKQGCMDCHDGVSRGLLSVFTSKPQLEQKMYHELAMPPDTDLPRLIERKELKAPDFSQDEAAALKEAYGMHAALVHDYEDSRLPALRDWLLETPCR
jgi:hypothetical protein